MKKFISLFFFVFLMICSLVFASCTAPEVKQVGKYFDRYKQISGNLYYDSKSPENLVYLINYNAKGERTCQQYKKDGVAYTYDVKNNEVCILGSIQTIIGTTTENITTSFETVPITSISITETTSLNIVTQTSSSTTTTKKKKKPKKTTTKATTIKTYPKTTSRRYVSTVKKTTTKKPTTTKKKIFKFEDKKYYIDENGKWILVK